MTLRQPPYNSSRTPSGLLVTATNGASVCVPTFENVGVPSSTQRGTFPTHTSDFQKHLRTAVVNTTAAAAATRHQRTSQGSHT